MSLVIVTLLTGMGAVVLALASLRLLGVLATLKQLPTTEHPQLRRLLAPQLVLTGIILLGYIAVLIAALLKIQVLGEVIVGLILLLGSLFALLGVVLQSQLVSAITREYARETKLRHEIDSQERAGQRLRDQNLELHDIKQHLEELVQQRTSELATANQVLQAEIEERRKAEQAAATASQLKSRFLAGVSHEIRTPLNAIIGFAELAMQNHSLTSIRQQIRVILRESNQLLYLVNDLLDHAKIEAGKLELDQRPFDINRLVSQIDSGAVDRAKGKGLQFLSSIGRDVPRFIVGDPVRLRQILLNLVGNAIKFTDQGSVQVRVDRMHGDSESVCIRFSVIDTGIGIAKAKQEQIFQSYTQVDAHAGKRYGGTGLGTTIARNLVNLMGGEIGVDSEAGRGSTFWFTVSFPVCDAPPAAEQLLFDLDEPAILPPAPAPGHSRGRILLAEDYFPNQEVIRLHLQKAGYSLDIVENGKRAVEACRTNDYDLILMDVEMPDMDGIEATRQIRSAGTSWSQVPILGITAHASAADRSACLEAGMNEVLTKPIGHQPLLMAVGKHMTTEITDDQVPATGGHRAERAATAAFDYESAVAVFGGDRTLVDTVLRLFLEQVESQLPLLQASLNSADTETLRQQAHKIRSGAANLTAAPLADSAERLEGMAAAGRMEEARQLMYRLEEELSRLRDTVLH